MSSESVDVSVKKQLEALSQEVARLSAASRHARQIRVVLMVAAFALCVTIIVAFYRLGNRVMAADHLDRLRAVAETRFEKRSDDYMRQVQMLVEHSSPVIGDAFTQQVKKDLPGTSRWWSTARRFANEVQEKLAAQLKQRFERALQSTSILHKEFPQINNRSSTSA